MGNFAEFASLLEKKIRKEIEKEVSSESYSPSAQPLQNELWTDLVGKMDPVRFRSEHHAQAYHRYQTKRAPLPSAPPAPDHQLTDSQQRAIEFFSQHNVMLARNMSQDDLKRAFRKMALKLHPDHGGGKIEFQTLLWARSELAKLFA